MSIGYGGSFCSTVSATLGTWGRKEVEAFLTDLAVRGQVSASTQNQAKSAILFLYREVIDKKLAWLDGVVAARASKRLPVVLSRDEVEAVMGRMRGTSALVARLLYGSGLRILEGLRLRVKDLDFAGGEILIRDAKGAKDRVTMLPPEPDRAAAAPSATGQGTSCRRLGGGLRFGLSSLRAGAQISECQPGVDVAVRVSGRPTVNRPAFRGGPAASRR